MSTTQGKVERPFKGHTFVAARDGTVVTITRDGRHVGRWLWDDEDGISADGRYVNLMDDTDDSEDVLSMLSRALRALTLPS